MNSISFLKQFKKLKNSSEFDWVQIKIDENDFDSNKNISLYFKASKESIYYGIHEVKLNFEKFFPEHPPKVTFVTKIWHPLIDYTTGEVCNGYFEDYWNNKSKNYKPTMYYDTEYFLKLLKDLLNFHKDLLNDITFIGINMNALEDIKNKEFEEKAKKISIKYALSSFTGE